MSAFTTPERVITEPTAPGAPQRIQRTNSNQVCYSINLSADFCDSSEDELTDHIRALVFPEMGAEEEDGYQEHYTLPEDQLYGDLPHPNVTLFRGSNPATEDADDSSIMNLSDEEEEEHEVDQEQERQREAQQIKCGPDFKFVEMDYRETQKQYSKCCAMCHDTMKYDNVYETSCEHALCCDCYNNHEDASAARCEIIRQGFLSCPVRSCRKTIRKVTGYKKRKDEKLFLDGPMIYCKETGYWVPSASKSK